MPRPRLLPAASPVHWPARSAIITVNTIAPAFVDTELTGSLDEDGRRRIAGRSALRRLPEADNVASMAEYLRGEGSRNTTGTVLTADAGNTA
jgi:3-oxoacyl-[acyl-carrier protein] reductase